MRALRVIRGHAGPFLVYVFRQTSPSWDAAAIVSFDAAVISAVMGDPLWLTVVAFAAWLVILSVWVAHSIGLYRVSLAGRYEVHNRNDIWGH